MSDFQTWFQQRSLYMLPDGTPVVAQHFDFDECPRWWFVEVHEHGRMGMIVAAVFPNRSVWNYVFEPDRGVCIPQCSDLTIDDLHPMPLSKAIGSWVARAVGVLALLWNLDGWGDMVGAATALAA